ncbi:MAG: hypothetical protein S4CHLAM81_03110 [Chlamydiales bacterium]|nr:hypothetical protein [Chlamydiales bacterium]MCH9635101.1 hypothetical protein [Chlamydiales bacterium]
MATLLATHLDQKKYYQSETSRMFDVGGTISECIDYMLCIIASVGTVVSSSFRAAGKEAPKGSEEVTGKTNSARMMVGALRSFQAFETIVTFKWLFTRDPSTGRLEKDEKGKPKMHSPLTVATILSLMAGRVLGFVNTLHNLKVVDLGKKHAPRISNATTVAFTALITLGLVGAIHRFAQAKAENMKSAAVDLVQSVSYVVMHPFECGLGMGSNVAPALGIVGGVVSAVAATAIIVTHIFQAKGFRVDPDFAP